MARPIPALDQICINLSTGPGELCVAFPGGTKICAQVGYELGDPSEITRSLVAQVNTALAPLMPVFDIIDFAKVLFDCISAIPDAITNLDPTALINCLPGLHKKLEALLALLPIMSIPLLVKSLIDVMINMLIGLKMDLTTLIRQQLRILAAATKAAQVGALQLVVDCASGNLDAHLQNMNSSLLPLNRLVGVLNLLLNTVGLPCIPTFAGLSKVATDQLKIIDNAIAILEAIKALIPVGDLHLPPIPAPTDPCK
jgi:hypothetical protein